MADTWRWLVRASAFLRKDLAETVRQPRLFAALVLAPFVILLLFGAGLKDRDPTVATVFVVPEDDALAAEVERFAAVPSWRLRVQEVSRDRRDAILRLQRGEVDLVVVFPEDAAATVRSNRRATVSLYHSIVDPIESRALGLATQAAVDRLNRHIVRSWIAEGQERAGDVDERVDRARERVTTLREAAQAGDQATTLAQLALLQADVLALSLELPAVGLFGAPEVAGDAGEEQPVGDLLADLAEGLAALSDEAQASVAEVDQVAADLEQLDRSLTEFRALNPETVINPFRGSLRRVGTVPVGLSDFFAPAVVVLLLQHMLVTLVGLSVVRDEQLGTNELLRISPLTAGQVLLGKYVSYLLLSGGVAVLLLLLLVHGLGVPLAGSVPGLVAAVAALIFTSIGMGFVVATLARTDSQAVQYAMMVLLASIFLTGFIISLERVVPWLQTLAWALPPTYGMALLRDVMLRGTPLRPLVLLGLFGIGVVLLAMSWALLRRRYRPAGVGRKGR